MERWKHIQTLTDILKKNFVKCFVPLQNSHISTSIFQCPQKEKKEIKDKKDTEGYPKIKI